MVAPSRIHIYKEGEINLDELVTRAQAILQKKPFFWQLEIAEAVLRGEDVIVDVGTGSGKTLCFALPLLKDDTDIVLIVSPLTALMIDQVSGFLRYDQTEITHFWSMLSRLGMPMCQL
jgi:superfamily II DNA helicase RecQ